MTRARPSLLLPLLAIAACQTQRKPLTGFDTPPPGILLDSNGGTSLLLMPIFDLPRTPERVFRPRLNGQDAVIVTSEEGFYDYSKVYLSGWTGGFTQWVNGVPPGTYAVELVDEAGQSWGKSAPLAIGAGISLLNPSGQVPAVVFSHFDGQAGSWTVDPSMQDSDPATDEITVTNLLDEDVVVERCLIAAAGPTSCTPVGTVAPQADLLTVETVVAPSNVDHQALLVHLASDATQSYQRDLIQGAGMFVGSCQVERILVHGRRAILPIGPTGFTGFAMSSCYGYRSSGT
jgi:hypothetical protein